MANDFFSFSRPSKKFSIFNRSTWQSCLSFLHSLSFLPSFLPSLSPFRTKYDISSNKSGRNRVNAARGNEKKEEKERGDRKSIEIHHQTQPCARVSLCPSSHPHRNRSDQQLLNRGTLNAPSLTLLRGRGRMHRSYDDTYWKGAKGETFRLTFLV